jgi:hypothetical protein
MPGDQIIAVAIALGTITFLGNRVLTRTILPELRDDAGGDYANGDCFPEPVLRGDFKVFHATSVSQGGQRNHG